MRDPIKLLPIPSDKYLDYRNNVIFNSYKWDPQVEDVNTICEDVAVISQEDALRLSKWAEELAKETMLMEATLNNKPSLQKKLGLSRAIRRALLSSKNYNPNDHIRIMRFDFHPTEEGWAISEVNSDVPGGFAEASTLPEISAKLFEGISPFGNFGKSLGEEFLKKLKINSNIAFVHATSYSDDRQVMEFIKDHLEQIGFRSIIVAPDHIRWTSDGARSIAKAQEGKIDGLIRFFPVEWLPNLSRSSRWGGYFNTTVLSCNHASAILTQSKRLPLVWDNLGIDIPTWKKLLPETADPMVVSSKHNQWILKPALGRVGEDISIREAISSQELKSITLRAKLFPTQWIAQKRFNSLPLDSLMGKRHLCIGVFTIQGKFAGFYGRINTYPRIDSKSQDIAILVADKEKINE